MSINLISFFINTVTSVLAASSVALLIGVSEQEIYFKAVTYSVLISMLFYPPLEHAVSSLDKEKLSATLNVIKNYFLITLAVLMPFMYVFPDYILYIGALICSLGELCVRISILQEKHKRIIFGNVLLLTAFVLLYYLVDKAHFSYGIKEHIAFFYFLRGALVSFTRYGSFKINYLLPLLDLRKLNYTLSNIINAVIGVIFINILYVNTQQMTANTFALCQRVFGTFLGVFSLWIYPISLRLVNDKKLMLRLFSLTWFFSVLLILFIFMIHYFYNDVCYKNICFNAGFLFSFILNVSVLPVVAFRFIESKYNKEKFRLRFNITFMVLYSIVLVIAPYIDIESIYILFYCNLFFNVMLIFSYLKFMKEIV
ncbi:hypothetical protein [Vibrio mimicus]|uniref:hypothetical protein n=1 Tax=Vibrio mimicus TaxID=674 RepID=UPI0011D45244|nr:hypothetical protein [Vibrio mimicus]TXY45629.1 hypothetical protein FXE78_14270 [Vibrio mimicus]BCN22251.1 putative O-antigen flippase [Vibrio mimicus]BCN22560.1 putative O-antigen flippase [Vibrio mimicus]